MRVVDRLLAWISQILHAEYLIANEDEEMFDEFPDIHLDLIGEAVTGLAVCYNQNPEGINFFKTEGDKIILVPSPYLILKRFSEIRRGLITPNLIWIQ